MILPKSWGELMRPSTRTMDSVNSLDMVPTGKLTLAARKALTTWSTLRPMAVSRTGSMRTWICRVTEPLSATRPTPRTRSKPFCTTCSAKVVSSRGVSLSASKA